MGDHVAVDIGELVASRATEAAGLASGKEEAEALIGMVECRICQEEDLAKNLESPCACSGSLKLFLLRAAGFLLPCYIMAWAISIMQRQRQRQVGD
ncbi:hypothetical protein PR202_ga01097 [Eleusine coracana subsp. coracana]|uniref:RING-CH-type domain-containing protein n=1 Tax=Eleusine coracana subsp. coracana TaxID=191504 RepID=A0AAV5BI75_ELECO|nr:hypothetical protein PR202_ga01097 [Eleusine coracana subsp. coracana]